MLHILVDGIIDNSNSTQVSNWVKNNNDFTLFVNKHLIESKYFSYNLC